MFLQCGCDAGLRLLECVIKFLVLIIQHHLTLLLPMFVMLRAVCFLLKLVENLEMKVGTHNAFCKLIISTKTESLCFLNSSLLAFYI